ncbi:MAG: tyrosine recombinase XerC [Eubacteriales bacterium]|jgi:site-specific recombinase XerD
MKNYEDIPDIIRNFLTYHETIKGHSKKTVDEYYLDLRTFFRFMKLKRNLVSDEIPFNEISIRDIDLDFVKSISLTDVYDFLSYLSREREIRYNSSESGIGLSAASRARKVATIKSFYKYLTLKAGLLDTNPVLNLDTPKLKKNLPRYLSENESIELLKAVEGKNKDRDYCIITLFLNCGLRISELISLNVNDIREDSLRVEFGKGGKVRILYLNDACREAIDRWLEVRSNMTGLSGDAKKALFVTRQNTRISKSAVHLLVKKALLQAGLDPSRYSSHKLRHTAATLMRKSGVDVRTLQEVLGHDHLNTTQIYTHVDSKDIRAATALNPLSKIKPED